MNAPDLHPDWISRTAMPPMPDWQRPGEDAAAFQARWPVEFAAWQAAADERLARYRGPGVGDVALASGVGTFDGNGLKKGAGW